VVEGSEVINLGFDGTAFVRQCQQIVDRVYVNRAEKPLVEILNRLLTSPWPAGVVIPHGALERMAEAISAGRAVKLDIAPFGRDPDGGWVERLPTIH